MTPAKRRPEPAGKARSDRSFYFVEWGILGLQFAIALEIGWAVHVENVWLLGTGVIVFLVLQAVRHRRDMRLATHPAGAEPDQAAPDIAIPRLSHEEVALIATAITDPATIVPRIKEYVVPRTRAIDSQSDYWLTFEVEGDADAIWFPIITPNKGDLIDHFRVKLTDGTEVPTTTFEESIGMVMACIDKLAAQFGEEVFNRYLQSVREHLVAAVASRGSAVGDPQHAQTLGMLSGVLGPEEPLTSLPVLMASELIMKYAVFAKLPVGCNWTAEAVKASRAIAAERATASGVAADAVQDDAREPVSNVTTHGRRTVNVVVRTNIRSVPFRRVVGRAGYAWRYVREIVGVRENTFDHSLEQAARTQSYHLEFLGPEGTYLAEQVFEPELSGNPPFRYSRSRGRHGQRYAHWYIRGATAGVREFVLRFRFHERPPGSIGTATIAALASLVGIYATSRVALANHTSTALWWPISQPTSPGSDAVALLVALPGLAFGVLEIGRSRGMTGGAVTAKISAATTFMLSCIATLLYFVGHIPSWTNADRHISYPTAWTILLVLSSTNWIMAASSWLRQSMHYSYLLRNDIDKDDDPLRLRQHVTEA